MKYFITDKKQKFMHLYSMFCGFFASILLGYGSVFAEGSGTEKIDTFINFAAEWLIKIGGVVALIGGVMFALSWQREDAEGKSRALMSIMAGLMLVAVAQARSIFGV